MYIQFGLRHSYDTFKCEVKQHLSANLILFSASLGVNELLPVFDLSLCVISVTETTHADVV